MMLLELSDNLGPNLQKYIVTAFFYKKLKKDNTIDFIVVPTLTQMQKFCWVDFFQLCLGQKFIVRKINHV